MIPDPDIAAALASMVAQAGGGGIDWEKAWGLFTALGTATIAYLASTYKARRDAKMLQGSELSKQSDRIFLGWDKMLDRAQQIIDRQQAEMMAAVARAMELQRRLEEKESELDETRRRYHEALRELEELRGAGRRKRSSTSAGD